jgi:hypothetical protein
LARPRPGFVAVVQKGREDVFQVLKRGFGEGDVEVTWDRRSGRSCGVSEPERPERRNAAPDTWTTHGFLLARRALGEARGEPISIDRLLRAVNELSESLREAIDRMRRAVERAEREPPPDHL